MAYSSSSLNVNSKVHTCSSECEKSFSQLKKLYDEQREQLSDASVEIKAYDQDDKIDVLTYHKKLLAEALKEKEDLKTKLENWQSSSKNHGKLLNTQMSANDKFGLGYGDHRFDGILSYENEVLQSVFMNNDSNTDDRTLYDRFVTTDGMHAVPPLITENYIPSGPDIEIDESQFTYGPKQTQPKWQLRFGSDAPYLEEQVKTPRETVKNQFTHSQKPKVDKKELGYGFTVRACFVCGSLNHLIRDCDFHEKRMARKAELNNGWNNVQRVNKQNQFVPSAVLTRTGKIPVSTARASGTKNVSTARQSFNRQTVLTSTAVKINTVKPIVNRVRPANVFHKTHSPYSRPFKKTTVLSTNFSKQKFNTAKVNAVSAVGGKRETAVKSSAGCNWRPQRYNWHNVSKYNGGSILRNCYTFKDPLGRLKPKQAWAYLAEFQDFNGGPVAFGGSKGYITGKEFKNNDVIEFCGSKGIKWEYSNARTPQQNGVDERKNKTLIEAARTMLADSFLPNTF
ncbi:ribonuclease H-like domain-containing protein [Tanacetum coccineum]